MAILAMHAYNSGNESDRHILPRFFGRQIGNYEIVAERFSASGFSATAFRRAGSDVDAETIISIRGTNPESLLDPKNGYAVGAGLSGYFAPQLKEAIAFYQILASANPAVGLYDSKISLTGHSLGGGIAGYLSAVYGKNAIVFDNMQYYGSASFDHTSGVLDSELYHGGEKRELQNQTVSYATVGEVLSANRLGGSDHFTTYLNSYSNEDPIALHSMALHVVLQWASLKQVDNWYSVGNSLWSAFLGDAVASSISQVAGMAGSTSPSNVIQEAIAYSAVSSGEMPFGNAAIAAMFDDAGQLAMAKDQLLGIPLAASVENVVSQAIVEYAAKLALSSSTITENPLSTSGFVGLNATKTTINLDFSHAKWTFGDEFRGSAFKNAIISSAEDVLGSGTDLFIGLDLYAAARGMQSTGFDLVSSVSFQAAKIVSNYEVLGAGLNVLFLSSGGIDLTASTLDRIVVGSNGSNVFIGGKNSDVTLGKEGEDRFTGSAGDDIIDGGGDLLDENGEVDTVDYQSSPNGIAITYNPYSHPSNLTVQDGHGGTDKLRSIEKVIGTSGRDTLKIVGPIANGLNLTIDAANGQGASPYDTIDASGSWDGINVQIDRTSGTGFIRSSSTGGEIKLLNFHTGIHGSSQSDIIADLSSGSKRIDGGNGNDVITVGDDGSVVFGGRGYGRDVLTGGAGNDVLVGGLGGDVLNGEAGSDLLIGGDSAFSVERLYGGAGADRLIVVGSVERSDTIVDGGEGNDLYKSNATFVDAEHGPIIRFGRGSGHDEIEYTDIYSQSVNFLYVDMATVSREDVQIIWDAHQVGELDNSGRRSLIGDLVIVVKDTNDSILIRDVKGVQGPHLGSFSQTIHAGNTTYGTIDLRLPVEVRFSEDDYGGKLIVGDGVITVDTVIGSVDEYDLALAEYGLATRGEEMLGSVDVDYFGGTTGSDTAQLSGGDDVVDLSGGNDHIDGGEGYDKAYGFGGASNYSVGGTEAGGLTLTDIRTGSMSTLTNMEELRFVMDVDQAPKDTIRIISGSASADDLRSSGTTSIIVAGSGSDTIFLRGFANQVVGGDGEDTVIYEGSASQFIMGTGLDGRVMIGRSATSMSAVDLLSEIELVRFSDSGEEIELNGMPPGGSAGDDDLVGTDRADALFGGQGDDILTGNGGSDLLTGGLGNDVYVWSLGDGDDVISEDRFDSTGYEVLDMSSVSYWDVAVGARGGGLEITMLTTGERVFIENAWVSDSSDGWELPDYYGGVDEIRFLDYTMERDSINYIGWFG